MTPFWSSDIDVQNHFIGILPTNYDLMRSSQLNPDLRGYMCIYHARAGLRSHPIYPQVLQKFHVSSIVTSSPQQRVVNPFTQGAMIKKVFGLQMEKR